jgi:hypothetical protein
MVKINIKKYSRSNVNEVDPTDTEASIDYIESISQPKRRGRPKKVTISDQQPDEETQLNQYQNHKWKQKHMNSNPWKKKMVLFLMIPF